MYILESDVSDWPYFHVQRVFVVLQVLKLWMPVPVLLGPCFRCLR